MEHLELRCKTCNFYNHFSIQNLLGEDRVMNLYHYTSINTLLIILDKSEFRFSNRHFLNDETEGKYVFQLCKRHIDEICPPETSSDIKEKFKQKCDEMVDKMTDDPVAGFKIYQLSFSTCSDDLCMWNYYAQQTGCNLKFNKARLVDSFKSRLVDSNGNGKILLYGKVTYDQQNQIKMLNTLVSTFFQHLKGADLQSFLFVLTQAILQLGIFFKHPAFSVEHEYRVAYDLFNKDIAIKDLQDKPYEMNIYSKQNMLVPYIDVAFCPSDLEKITLAPTANAKLLIPGIQIAVQSKFGHIEKNNIDVSEIPIRF